ncbi:MAG: MFS transporter, partial [Gaiellaceae bacterium]
MSLLNEQNRKWWTLGTVTFSLFMVMLDTTIVNVALPAIQADLSLEISDLEWIVNGFLLTYAVFLLTGGKLADFLGRRRIFLTGFFVFVASSLACGLAVNGSMLIAARAAQGVGAALMLPGTLSIISATFSVRERGTAFGIWAGVSGLGLALGPLVGGLLTEGIGWRWIFFVNVPLGAIGLVAGGLIIRESRDTSEEQRLDVAGLVASGAALFLLTFALVEGNGYGWGSPVILMCFAGSAAAFAAFLLLEHRQRLPMLDLALFRNPTFAGASLVALTLTLALLGVLFFVSIYLQTILGYSAVRAGLAFMPMTLLFMALAPP